MASFQIIRKFTLILFILNYCFVAMAEDRREENLKLFTNIAKLRSSTIGNDFPKEIQFSENTNPRTISELISNIQNFEHELNATKRKRSVYFETYKLIKKTQKRYQDVVTESQRNYLEATGREPNEEELSAAIRRKFGIDYKIIQDLLLAAPNYIEQFEKYNNHFLIEYNRLSDNFISKYNKSGVLIHPSLPVDEFIKYIGNLPRDSSCKIGKVQKITKYNEPYLRIYLANNVDSFEVAAKRLGATVLNFNAESSSLAKGESLYDTLKTFEAFGIDIGIIVNGNVKQWGFGANRANFNNGNFNAGIIIGN